MSEPPSLSGAGWLGDSRVRRVFAVLNQDGEEGRAVGGAVRDGLMDQAVTDVDFATTALPDKVMARAAEAGIKAIPTGIEHGTVTLALGGRGYEVTTLREDVETDGRHAVVRFGRDWEADARRRDFTINALSAEADGTVHDPVGGYADIMAGRVRFIGDADTRIAEDRLRLLRFFRFHAERGRGEIDRDGFAAAVRARNGIRDLAAERINAEFRRLLLARRAAETVRIVQDAGILSVILGGIGYPRRLERVAAFESAAGLAGAYPRRLAALAAAISEDAERVAARLRLSNADSDRMRAAVESGARWRVPPVEKAAKAAIYELGRPSFDDALALAAANRPGTAEEWAAPARRLGDWRVPKFPISGKDLLANGVLRGPMLGAILKQLESWWIDQDFAPDREALLARLQQVQASQQ